MSLAIPVTCESLRTADGAASRAANSWETLPRIVLRGNLIAIAVLGTFHALLTWAPAGTYHPLVVKLVNLDYEMNLPTWFASLQWLALALALAVVAWSLHDSGERRPRVLGWCGFACAAMYLSADETALIHERLGTLFEEAVAATSADSSWQYLTEFPSYYWIALYGPVALPAALALGVFLWRELGPARHIAIAGIFVFLYAAVGLDFIEGHWGSPDGTTLPLSIGSRTFDFDIFMLEELLEMLGVALLLHAILRRLATRASVAPAGEVTRRIHG